MVVNGFPMIWIEFEMRRNPELKYQPMFVKTAEEFHQGLEESLLAASGRNDAFTDGSNISSSSSSLTSHRHFLYSITEYKFCPVEYIQLRHLPASSDWERWLRSGTTYYKSPRCTPHTNHSTKEWQEIRVNKNYPLALWFMIHPLRYAKAFLHDYI